MDFLRLGAMTKTVAALVALAVIPLVGLWLTRPVLSLAENQSYIAGARARTRFVFQVATLPALTAILLIIPFRVHREWVEVVMVPAIVTLIGIAWLQSGAWRVNGVSARGTLGAGSIAYPLTAVGSIGGVSASVEAGHSLLSSCACASEFARRADETGSDDNSLRVRS